MRAPAAVMGDQVQAMCVGHQMASPTGAPVPAPPVPFSAPLTVALEPTVRVGGKPVAVVGANGLNTPPHVGLHASDPFLVPAMQTARVVQGSSTVLAGGKPVASSQAQSLCCIGAQGT